MNSRLVFVTVIITSCICVGSQGRKCARPIITNYDFNSPDIVCGSDGHRYLSEVDLENHNCVTGDNVTVAHNGKCERYCPYMRPIYRPVCGKDRKTYYNEDVINNLNCKSEGLFGAPIIQVGHFGECKEECNIPDFLKYENDGRHPVCGSDGRIHRSKIALEAYNCAQGLEGGRRITVVDVDDVKYCFGKCKLDFDGGPFEWCGSDGKTYFSKSSIEYYNCLNDLTGEDKVVALFNDPCPIDCPITDDLHYEPICGTDNVTYYNYKILVERNCLRSVNVKIAYVGRCGEPCPTYQEDPFEYIRCVDRIFEE